METIHHYQVDLQWQGSRKGMISSPVLSESIEIATPPEFKGGIAGIWSPEHLLVAAVNSCLMTTFLAIAENSGLAFEHFQCHASGKLEKVENRYLISEILLKPELTIVQGTDPGKAERVLRKAEAACLISNSVKSRILMEPKISFSQQGMPVAN